MTEPSAVETPAHISLSEHLQQLTESLAGTHTQQQVFAAALEPAISALDAVAGAVLLLDPQTQCLSVMAIQGKDAQTVWQDGPLSPETPAGDVLNSGQPLYFEHAGALKAAYPHLEAQTGGIASVASAVLPLLLEGQALGVLILDFREPHTFTPEERRFLPGLASQTSVAVSRAQLLSQRELEAERFRRMVKVSPVGMAVGSVDGQLTLVNDAYLHLLGYTRAEYERGEIDWQTLTPEEYRAQDQRAFEAAFSQGVSTSYEKEMFTKAGERLPLELTLIRYDPQQVVGYLKDLRVHRAQAQLVAAQAATLQTEQDAMRTFVQFTESAGQITDLDELARLALGTLQALIPGANVVLTELTPTCWALRHWTDNLAPELLAMAREHGFPLETPVFAELLETREPSFTNGWDETEQEVAHSGQFQAVAHYPVMQEGRVVAAIGLAVTDQQTWTQAQKAIVRSVGRSFTLLYDRISVTGQAQLQRKEAEQRSQVLEAFSALMAELNVQQSPYELIQRAQEIVLSLLPEGHSVYWEPVNGLWRIYAQTGEVGRPDLQALLAAGLPVGQFPTIDRPWQTGEPEYHDQYTAGRDLSVQLTDHLQSVAVMPIFEGETLRGVMNFTLTEPHIWRAVDQVVLETVQQSLSLALDRLYQQQVIVQEQAASEAFVTFAEAAGQTDDIEQLVQLAMSTIEAVLPGSTVGLYTRGPDSWLLRYWNAHIDPALRELLRIHGLPLNLSLAVEVEHTQDAMFVDREEVRALHLKHTGPFQTEMMYPVLRQGQVYLLLSVALETQSAWTSLQKATLRALGRSFTLLYDRIAAAEELRLQREEAQRQAQVLEAFMLLTRDQVDESDTLALIRRAQELVLSLLPPGYAAYFEPEAGLWRVRMQTGSSGSTVLQAAIDTGFPVGATPTLDIGAQTRQPYFVEVYNHTTDTDPEVAGHLNAAACLPLIIHGEVRGIFNVPLFETRRWAPADRVLLTTAVRSLGLVIERAERTAQLAWANRNLEERTRSLDERTGQLEHSNEELRASNEELEAFTYSASHDLRTPVRHVMGFAEMAEKALAKGQHEKVGQSLEIVKQGALRMTDLIDGMLVLSKSGRQELHVQPVDLNALATQARRDVTAEFGRHPVRWQIGDLPVVQGDRQLLQQVMTNLLSNAVKYSAKREVSEVEVTCEERGPEWCVSVTDNGVGFDPNYAQKLFGIFQRLHTEREFKGTGVGLATVKRIVQKHGGQVFAESLGAVGATFGFTLPKRFG